MGRPGPQALPVNLKRTHRIGVYFNEFELSELEEILERPGLAQVVMNGGKDVRKGMKGASEYLRARSLGQHIPRVVPKLNMKAFAELGRLGGIVNQIADGLASGLLNPAEREVLAGVIADLTEFRAKLIGTDLWAPAPADLDHFAGDESEMILD